MANKFYLTTPIYYVNARPHIGHAYSTIAADVIARRHRLLGEDVFFLTGTDEHGQKVQRSAAAAGIPPQQFTDEVSASFSNLWKRMGITNDDFIRTTDPRHIRGVQKLFSALKDRGFIEPRTYTGQYCVSEEMFVDGPPGTLGPDGKPTETVSELNFFFKLSEFQRPILDLIESNQLHIQPDTVRNEVLSFLRGPVALLQNEGEVWVERYAKPNREPENLSEILETMEFVRVEEPSLTDAGTPYIPGALKDLSISRSSFKWGIPVPTDKNVIVDEARGISIQLAPHVLLNEEHVIYVWLDALANYITAIGYGSENLVEQAKFEKYWPADLHLVGKEITRFHCVYWPAFLLAAGLPLPKSVVANGWLLFEESKMSKSRGNVVRTETILEAFGPLCPPPPLLSPPSLSSRSAAEGSAVVLGGPENNSGVILSAAKDPEAANTATSDRPFQPPSSPEPPPPSTVLLKGTASAVPQTAPPEAAALAAEVTPAQPTKAQQDLFAADVLRYYLLREIPFGQDGSFSFDALITRYNADLANGYGNLVSRTFKMISNYFGDLVPEVPPQIIEEVIMLVNLQATFAWKEELLAPLYRDFQEQRFDRYLQGIEVFISVTDETISTMAPWKPKATDQLTLDNRQYCLVYSWQMIRIITALLYPILPYATASVWAQLGLGSIEEAAKNGELKNLQWGGLKPGTKLGPLTPIFPRADKGLAQVMTDLESPTTPPPEPTTPEPRTSNPEPDSSPITIDDFTRIDLRVAQIVVAERIPKADKLLRLEVDLGPDHPRRQILSGIAEWYTPEELIGRRIAIIANLAPRKMRGLESHGMLLAASADDHTSKPILATFSDEVPLGSRIK